MYIINRFIVGTRFPQQLNYNLSFFIVRFIVGLALCTVFEKLFPKNGLWGPQAWFVQDVTDMGFPFPYIMAWISVLTEFVGGIFLMLGFLTRPAALMNAVVTFVAAFVYHDADIGGAGLTAFIFFILCLGILLNGAGTYSLDCLIHKKYLNHGE